MLHHISACAKSADHVKMSKVDYTSLMLNFAISSELLSLSFSWASLSACLINTFTLHKMLWLAISIFQPLHKIVAE